jgi:large subunit ribosomal protein L16
MPQSSRYRKFFKGAKSRKQNNDSSFHQGRFAIQILDSCSLTTKQIETLRRCLTRCSGREGKHWLRIFPNQAVSRKPSDSRMGKGKGSTKFWNVKIPAGQIIFEAVTVPTQLINLATHTINRKTSCRVRIIQQF